MKSLTVVLLGVIVLEGRRRTGLPKWLAHLGWERGRAEAVGVFAVESFEVGVTRRAMVDQAQNGRSADA
jgi:hypothetical protein